MATSRLGLYNIGLLFIGERTLDSLTEDNEARRLLDEVYTRGNGAIRYFLEQGHWNHAMRAVKLEASSDVTPAFGYTYAFERPSDFVRLNMLSADENFSFPLEDYEPEANYYYAWQDPLYMRYVSDDEDWGADLSLWPETFSLWSGSWLGVQIAPVLKNDLDMERLKKDLNRLLIDARSKDASQEPPRYPPPSSWETARRSRYYSRRDRGNRGSLIG